MTTDLRVELLIVPSCPHAGPAAELLRTALDDIGLSECPFAIATVATEHDATARGFVGSPTFTVDGNDLFPRPQQSSALACRLYGPGAVLPPVEALRKNLKRAAAAHRRAAGP